jgi:pimeloyl-ACP methyl ester carboxylesterase
MEISALDRIHRGIAENRDRKDPAIQVEGALGLRGFDWRAGASSALTVGGTRLETLCWGPAPDRAPTLVMLHEGLGCVALWRDFPQKLAAATGFGAFAYSRAGYGQSDPVVLPRSLDYMTREARESLPVVLDAIGFRRGILLGHSDGASIAAIYAGSVEDFRVRGLVLMAPHFFTEPSGLAAIAAAREAFESGDLRTRLAKYHRDADNAFRGWNEAWLDPGFKAWNIADCIDYWRVPALAIQGVDDPYGTLAQIREIEARAYSPVDVDIVDECKHAPHLEQPERTMAAIADFCARLERIERTAVEVR